MNAASIVNALLTVTLSVSVLTMIVLLLRGPIARGLGATAAYGLWLAIPVQLLALLVPKTSSTSLLALPSLQAVGYSGPVLANPWGLPEVLLGLWAAGFFVLALRLVLQVLHAQRLIRSGEPLAGARSRGLRILSSESISSPVVAGLFRPVMLVPLDFEQRRDTEHLDWILRHEQCHARRRDNLVNLLAHAIQAVFWFNPLAWMAVRAFRIDQELSCDEYALADADSSARLAYGRALIRARQAITRDAVLSPWNLTSSTRRRIEMLALHRVSRSRRLGGMALAGVITLLSGATAADLDMNPSAESTPTDPRVVARVNPLYPVSAANDRVEGEVVLEFRIRTDGAVDDIRVVDSMPQGVFDQVAVDAMSKWRFEPAMAEGQPVARRATQTMEFRLD